MVEIVAKFHGMIAGDTGETLETDKNHVGTGSVLYDAIFIPGGRKSVDTMMQQGDVIHFVNETFKHCKPVAAFGEAVELLKSSSMVGVNFAAETDSQSMAHMGVVTARKHDHLKHFLDKFKAAIAAHRHWEREANKDKVPA